MKAAALVAGIMLIPASCATHRESRVARFAQTVLTKRLNGNPGFAWARLEPAHQRLMTRALFSRCVREGVGQRPPRFVVTVIAEHPIALHRRDVAARRAERVRLRITAVYKTTTETVGPWPVDVITRPTGFRWLLDASTESQLRSQPGVCPE